MPNQSYHHGDLKAELIRAGLKILDQEGYDGFSLRKVAKVCNVSQTAPYRHFKNKEELIIAIALEALQAFNDSLEQPVLQNPDNPRKQLTEMGLSYVCFFVKNPEYLRLLFSNDMYERMNAYYCSNLDQFQLCHPFQTFRSAVERYKAAAPEQTLSLEHLLLYCWGLVHGISILISNKDFQYDGDCLELARGIFESDKFLV